MGRIFLLVTLSDLSEYLSVIDWIVTCALLLVTSGAFTWVFETLLFMNMLRVGMIGEHCVILYQFATNPFHQTHSSSQTAFTELAGELVGFFLHPIYDSLFNL